MRRRLDRELVVISWRDIPAQVNGGTGPDKHQVGLAPRFLRAIDRAAVKAGKKTADQYVAEWRRHTVPVPTDFDGDWAAAVTGHARQLESDFTQERISVLVANGGWAQPEARPT